MKLNELLGIEFPIIQGGMANVATGKFAAAVSNAGALGLVAGGGLDAEALRAEIRDAKAATDKPFGVNLMLMNPHIDELAKVVVEEGVQVVTTGAGNPGKYVPAWKEAGIKVFPVVAAPSPSSPPAASPTAASCAPPLPWGPAACRWAPSCWPVRSAPFTTTTRGPSSRRGPTTPWSPAAPAAPPSGC